MKNKKIAITALLLSLSMATAGVNAAFDAAVAPPGADRRVVISGNVTGDDPSAVNIINIAVYNPGFEIDPWETEERPALVAPGDFKAGINHITSIIPDATGSFEYTYKMKGETGTYVAYISDMISGEVIKQEFYYENNIFNEFCEMQKQSFDEFSAFIKSEMASVGFNTYAYDKLTDDSVKNKIIDGLYKTTVESIEKLKNNFVLMTFSALCENTESAEDITDTVLHFYENGLQDFGGKTIKFWYENLDTDAQKAVMQNFAKKPVADLQKFVSEVADHTVKQYLSQCEYWGNVDKLVSDDNVFDLDKEDMKDYANLENPDEVLKEIYTLRDKTENTKQLQQAFATAVANQKKAEEDAKSNPGLGGGSSGGGGGGGGGFSSSAQKYAISGEVTAPETKPETNVDTTPVQPMLKFSDVPHNHWAAKSISALTEECIISGFEDGTFRPDDYVTREQFVKMLTGALRITGVEKTVSFDDVKETDWFYMPVAGAYNKGIVTGISETLFGTGSYISRQDAAVMTARAAEKMEYTLSDDNNRSVSDFESVATYAKASVEKLLKSGIISGTSDGLFMPLDNITRAQCAEIICKFMAAANLI